VNEPELGTEAEVESRIGDALRDAAINGDAELARKTTRDAFATRLFLVVGVGMLVIAVVFAYITLRAVRATQNQTADCVTPGSKCYTQRVEQDKAQTTAIVAGVIGGVNEVSIYAAWCANKPGYQTIAEIQKCVTDKIHPK
jgi:preprotein translocase subunit SecG